MHESVWSYLHGKDALCANIFSYLRSMIQAVPKEYSEKTAFMETIQIDRSYNVRDHAGDL